MKANVATVPGETESDEITADVAILVQLSTVHGALARLARERDELTATLAARRRALEQPAVDQGPHDASIAAKQQAVDRERTDLDLLAADLTPRLAALATEEATAEGRARRLAGGLSLDGRRIYSSLATARRLPFAVTLRGDCCSGCNMRLPSGLLGEIRRVRRLHRCPSCKRVVSSSAA